jgi:hypothetical protein
VTLLPDAFLSLVHKHAVSGAKNHLDDILTLREYLDECGNEPGFAPQAKREVAAAMLVSLWSVERSLWIVKDTPEETLRRWLDSGFSMSHIETANREYQIAGYESPAALIEAAIVCGNAEGKPMTCAEFFDFATGDTERPQKEVKLIRLKQSMLKISKRVGVVLQWNDDKRAEFERELQTLWTRYIK